MKLFSINILAPRGEEEVVHELERVLQIQVRGTPQSKKRLNQ